MKPVNLALSIDICLVRIFSDRLYTELDHQIDIFQENSMFLRYTTMISQNLAYKMKDRVIKDLNETS